MIYLESNFKVKGHQWSESLTNMNISDFWAVSEIFHNYMYNSFIFYRTFTKCKMAATIFHRASAWAKENPITLRAFITER